MKSRILLPALGVATVVLAVAFAAGPGRIDAGEQTAAKAAAAPTPIQVYKTPTCGCCAKWVEHMQAEGFAPAVTDTPELGSVKAKYGVPSHLASCHTAIVGGYVIEGHVPADVVRKLLAEKPKVTGITVPGMPMGSPGMEHGGQKDPYDVLTFVPSGETQVFAKR